MRRISSKVLNPSGRVIAKSREDTSSNQGAAGLRLASFFESHPFLEGGSYFAHLS